MKNAILQKLKEGLVEVVFTKLNGDRRVMLCTLNESRIPEDGLKFANSDKKTSDDIIKAYDIEAKGWRSFRHDSVINYSSCNE